MFENGSFILIIFHSQNNDDQRPSTEEIYLSMSSIPRPITTSNSRQEKHQFHRMDAEPSVELDEDYFEALKVSLFSVRENKSDCFRSISSSEN